MAKISKRIIAVVLMVAMLTTLLSGCSNDQKEVSPVPDNTQQVTPTENVTDVVTPTAAVIETGYKVYGHDADLIISEDWHDYIGRLDVFVYGLISEDFGIDFDVFPAGIVLPDGREVCGIAYTDYTECYTDETETKNYVATGFISAIGEDGITQEEMDSGLIIDDLENPDCSFDLLYEYRSAPYKDHCVVYGQYLTYGVDDNGCIFYENEPYQKEKCDESLGALYSYDEGRYLFNPNVGDFVPLTGETLSEKIDYTEIEKAINEALEEQNLNFSQVDVDSCFSIAQESVVSYLLSLQTETFMGYDTNELVKIASELKKDECLRITEEGALVIEVEPDIQEPSQLVRKIVGVTSGIVFLCGMVASGGMAIPYAMATGVIAGAASDLFLQVFMNKKGLNEIDLRSLMISTVVTSLAAASFTTFGVDERIAYKVIDTILDGVLGGIDRAARAGFIDGKNGKEIVIEFGKGFAIAVAISAAFKIVMGVGGKAVTRVSSKIPDSVKKKISDSKIVKGLKSVKEKIINSKFYNEKILKRRFFNQARKSANKLSGEITDLNGRVLSKDELVELILSSKEGSTIGYNIVNGQSRNLVVIKNTVFPDLMEDAIDSTQIAKIVSTRSKNIPDAAKNFLDKYKKDPTQIPKEILDYMKQQGIDINSINSVADFRKIISASGLVFHECPDLKTVIIISKSVHEAFRHTGGVSIAKALEIAVGKTEFSNFISASTIAGFVD